MRRRVGLAQLMALIVVLAVGLAAIRVATVGMTRAVVYLGLLALIVATVRVAVRPGTDRPGWIGAVVFGWCYALLLMPIPHINGGRSPNMDRDDLTEVWQIDGPIVEAALFFHPLLPEPTEPPSPPGTLYDASTNSYTKDIGNGARGPFSPAELKAQADFKVLRQQFSDRIDLAKRAHVIGLMLQGIAFTFVGAIVGTRLAGSPLVPEVIAS